MSTLTDTAYVSRKIFKFGVIFLVIYIILRIVFAFISRWWIENRPEQVPDITPTFGKLPYLPFPDKGKPQLSFYLETISNDTGKFPDQAKVFLMPSGQANLLAFDRASQLAKKIGFGAEPRKINDTLYEWEKTNPLPSVLQINTLTNHFTYNVNWRVRPDLLLTALTSTEDKNIKFTRKWFKNLGKLPKDLEEGKAKVIYLKVEGTELIPTTYRGEAKMVKVILTRAPYKKKRIWPIDPNQGIASLSYISSSRDLGGKTTIIEAEYQYQAVNYKEDAIYPIISSDLAWERLQEGKGFHASMTEEIKDIAIRNISLGYFDPSQSGFYLQPIYIFEGDGNFVGYVQAITDTWLEEDG